MKPAPSLKLVIFDCDGVLIDSEVLMHRALIEALARYGVHMTCDEAIERYTGHPSNFEKEDIEARYHITLPPECFEIRRSIVSELYKKELRPIPGVLDLVATLAINRCVASGSMVERVENALEQVGLLPYFTPYIFSSQQVARGKPAPDVFLFAANKMGVDPASCLVIEDSAPGIQAAAAAGMRAFGFVGGSHCKEGLGSQLLREGAERVFTHMRDLARALPDAT